MATAAETRMNLAALQQRDPYIVSIVDTASQVALYKFNAKTNEWVSFSPLEGILDEIQTVRCLMLMSSLGHTLLIACCQLT